MLPTGIFSSRDTVHPEWKLHPKFLQAQILATHCLARRPASLILGHLLQQPSMSMHPCLCYSVFARSFCRRTLTSRLPRTNYYFPLPVVCPVWSENFPCYPHSGTQALGVSTIWNITSSYGRWKETWKVCTCPKMTHRVFLLIFHWLKQARWLTLNKWAEKPNLSRLQK